MSPIDLVLFGGLAGAALTDVRSGRIPNALTFPMMALGIAVNAAQGLGLGGALVGCALAFAIHFPLWSLGVQKAGDAKLFMGVGACLGWRGAVEASLWYAVVYLPVGLLVLAASGQLGGVLASARYAARRASGQPAGEPPPTTPLRVGPVILAAGALARLTTLLEGLV